MAVSKITTTPTPLSVVDKINEVIDGKLDTTAKAASATTADSATTLSGLTATVAELNYVDGVTSNVQTQLDGKLSTSGTAAKATADASGNNIANTYATKAQAVTNLTASGKTVTFTKADGSTGTFTTQDTTYSLPTASSSTLGGIKVGSGLSISNGVLSSSGGSAAVSAYKIPYATCSTATSTAAKVATITNGVSFALVAGAICLVTFTASNNTNLYGHLYHNASLVTLNINSTGAKTLGVESNSNNGEAFSTVDYTILALYNGTRYSVSVGHMYPDYSDSD